MIQLSLLFPALPQVSAPTALPASQGASNFALALGALASPARVAVTDERAALPGDSEGEILLPARQMPADSGKDLPGVTTDDGEVEDKANEDGDDIAFAWFAVAAAPVPAIATPVVTSGASAARVVPSEPGAWAAAHHSEPDITCEVPAALALQRSEDTAVLAARADTEATVAVPSAPAKAVSVDAAVKLPLPLGTVAEPASRLNAPIDSHPDVAVPQAQLSALWDRPIVTDPKPMAPAVAAFRPAAFPDATNLIVQRAEVPPRQVEFTIQPTSGPSADEAAASVRRMPDPTQSVPAAAIAPVVVALPVRTPGSPLAARIVEAVSVAPAPLRRSMDLEPLAAALQLPGAETARLQAVSAPADVQQGALDTRRQEWVGKMVEHIEALRDAAPVRETRLNLAPEALGKVEIAIRHEGDRVHVHFATETPAARQLIADAQPRLAELAEARGLKLGQTSFESGTAGQEGNRDSRDNSAPQQSLRPQPANPESDGAAADDRIA